MLGHVHDILRLRGREVLRVHRLLLLLTVLRDLLRKITHIQLWLITSGRVICQHWYSRLIHELIELGLVDHLHGLIWHERSLRDACSRKRLLCLENDRQTSLLRFLNATIAFVSHHAAVHLLRNLLQIHYAIGLGRLGLDVDWLDL